MAGTPDGVPATGTSGLVQTGAVTHERIPVDLTGVPETLLWTLSFRAQEAARPDALLADPLAVDLVRRIDYPFAERLGSGANRAQWQALRSATFDRVVRAFLGSAAARGRAPVVVSLGEGLETAFWRCDDGRVEWVGVDLPETAALRRAVLPPHERRVQVDGSALDDEWLDAVRDVLVRTGSAPSCTLCHSHVSRRVRTTRSATISIAVARSIRSQSSAYGRRYSTSYRRPSPVVSCRLAAPLGHSRPRLTGESRSPSMWTTFSSLT